MANSARPVATLVLALAGAGLMACEDDAELAQDAGALQETEAGAAADDGAACDDDACDAMLRDTAQDRADVADHASTDVDAALPVQDADVTRDDALALDAGALHDAAAQADGAHPAQNDAACTLAASDGECCAAGSYRCNALTKHVDFCGLEQRWQTVSVCGTTQICRLQDGVGACQPNLPYDVGNGVAAPDAGWRPFAVAADTIYAVPIKTPARPTKLAAFRHRGSAIGGSCRMGLYTQRPDGRPGTLLAVSDSLLVLEGINGGLPNLNVALTPDTHYWVAAACGDAQSVTLLEQESATQTQYTYTNASLFAYGDPLPASFPSEAQQHTGGPVSFFVQLRDVP